MLYKTAKYDTAYIRGKVTGAASGDIAALLAEPFGTKSFVPTGAKVKVGSCTRSWKGYFLVPASAYKTEPVNLFRAGPAYAEVPVSV